MKFTTAIFLALWLTGGALAGEILPSLTVDGVTYENVKFGPVNRGQVVIFHNRGIETIAVAKLPAHLRARLGVTDSSGSEVPVPAPTGSLPQMKPLPRSRPRLTRQPQLPSPETAVYREFEEDRGRWAYRDGKLVDKSQFTPLTGILKYNTVEITIGEPTYRGCTMEVAALKENADQIPEIYRLRPGLWHGTGEVVFLLDYQPSFGTGTVFRVYGKSVEPVERYPAYEVATELTYDQWKKLRGR